MRVTAPRLARSNIAPPKAGIVHLGLGAFFRAHGAIYIDEAVKTSGGNWGVIGVSLKSSSTRDLLAPQEFVYTAQEMRPKGSGLRTIEVIRDVLVAREDPSAVLSAMADPGIRIVSLTITEKGYCHDPLTGQLNLDHPDIKLDLKHELPVSAPGFIVRALALRKSAGIPPFTVLSCDNLPGNGQLVRQIVLRLANQIDPELATWIKAECRFPSTMVDRIVPATEPEDIEKLAALTHCIDLAPVLHEPYRQWVVENDFVPAFGVEAKPDLGSVGVELVKDVTAHENMKLRMLNGTHSLLAYAGFVAGFPSVQSCIENPQIRALAQYHLKSASATLVPIAGLDYERYAKNLICRFGNPNISHSTYQIAMDGTQKLQQRIYLPTMELITAGNNFDSFAFATAAWLRYAMGSTEAQLNYALRDPLEDELCSAFEDCSTASQIVTAACQITDLFPEELSRNSEWLTKVTGHLNVILERCVLAAAEAMVQS